MEINDIILKNIENVGKEISILSKKTPCPYEEATYNNVLGEYRIAWKGIKMGEDPLTILSVLCEKTDYCAQTGMLVIVKNILTGKGSMCYGLDESGELYAKVVW